MEGWYNLYRRHSSIAYHTPMTYEAGAVMILYGKLLNLEKLLLNGNQLSGMLAQSLTNLTNLKIFYFRGAGGVCAPLDAAFKRGFRALRMLVAQMARDRSHSDG